MASDTDGCRLASNHLLGISSLVVPLAVITQIVADAVLVVVVFGQSGIQPCPESSHVHGIRVKDILIFDFLPVPGFCHMYLVGVCFGILTAFLFAENVCR